MRIKIRITGKTTGAFVSGEPSVSVDLTAEEAEMEIAVDSVLLLLVGLGVATLPADPDIEPGDPEQIREMLSFPENPTPDF